jgi:carbon monoxide dehydrogenase subunit G
MEMSGERRIPAPRTHVWEALNDPERLRMAIPGCEEIEKTSDTEMTAKVALKIGPMAARFAGKVKLENLNPPESYTITGEGNGGAMGFAKGGADVRLEEVGPSETILRYNVKAQVGGKMAQLGGRLIDSTANQMAGLFFDRLAAQLSPSLMPGQGLATPAPVSHKHIPVKPPFPSELFGVPIPVLLGGAAMLLVLYLIFLSS